ncbi:MAG: Hint domain-containing protein, partial [Pseudomonadota bacterium]
MTNSHFVPELLSFSPRNVNTRQEVLNTAERRAVEIGLQAARVDKIIGGDRTSNIEVIDRLQAAVDAAGLLRSNEGLEKIDTVISRIANLGVAAELRKQALNKHVERVLQKMGEVPLTEEEIRKINAMFSKGFVDGIRDQGSLDPDKCFLAGTPIAMGNGEEKPIEFVKQGDIVFSYDQHASFGRCALFSKKVLRTFTNITDEWLRLTWIEKGEAKELVTTPGHHFLAAQGGFKDIESLVAGGRGTIVLADGTEAEVTSERIVYSAETADMFEQAAGYVYPENGNLALKPVYKKGWKTYNFEVEDFHTYVAGGARVHNDSWSDGSGFEYAGWQSRDGVATVELSDGTRAPLNGEDVLYDRLSMPASYRDTPEAHADSLAFGLGKAGYSFKDVSYASWREHTLHRQTPEQKAQGLLPEPITDPREFSRREAHHNYKNKQGEKAAAPGSNQNSGRDTESSAVDTTRSRETGIGSGGLGDYDNDGEVSAREFNRARSEDKYNDGSGKSDGESGGNGGGGKPPIIFDLDDDGIEVTALDRSTIFMDTAGDGFLRRTAWAGEGDGVLYFDPDGRNEITEKRQFIFTEWDPTATNDLEAIDTVAVRIEDGGNG